jgi:hypothetical protein
MLCGERMVDMCCLISRNVAKRDSDYQRAGSSVGDRGGRVWRHGTDHAGEPLQRMPLRCRLT